MSMQRDFTDQERAALEAAFKIIHAAMVECDQSVVMLTSPMVDSGNPGELLISHFVRGDSSVAALAAHVGRDGPAH